MGEYENGPEVVSGRPHQRNRLTWALKEFLLAPLLVVAGVVVLAGLAAMADRASAPWLLSMRDAVATVVPPGATSTMLQTVTPGMLTAISIIFFVMLMTVQQQATTYTTAVLDQFMHRWLNQVFFGLFIGLAVYYVAVLTVIAPGQAVLSAALASVLTVTALILLLVFIYNTFDQLRPSSSASLIVYHALRARSTQQALLARCRGTSQLAGMATTHATVLYSGYIVAIDIDVLAAAIGKTHGPVEIEFHVVVGTHIVIGDTVADVRGHHGEDRDRLATAVLDSMTIARMRDISKDAGYGVDQLAAMAWASSSSQQDPEGAAIAIGALHSLLASWGSGDQPAAAPFGGRLPIVYTDEIVQRILDALTAVVVATGQSGQHQTCSEVLTIFARILPLLAPTYQRAAVDDIARVISTATAHVLTVKMEDAIGLLRRSLCDAGYQGASRRLEETESELARQVRELTSPQQ